MKSAPQKRARLRSRLLIAMATVVTSCLLAIAIPFTSYAAYVPTTITAYSGTAWSGMVFKFKPHYNLSSEFTVPYYEQEINSSIYTEVPSSVSSQVNTFPLTEYIEPQLHIYATYNWSGSLWNVGFTYSFNGPLTILAGEEMEFWIQIRKFEVTESDTHVLFYTTSAGSVSTSGGDSITFTSLTSATDSQGYQWQCYRASAPDNSNVTFTSLVFSPTEPWGGGWTGDMNLTFSIVLGPVFVGELSTYDVSNYEDQVLGGIGDIINGDSLPDPPDPDYDNIQGNPDYNVGDKVGEDEAIGELGNMQAGADYYITSDSMLGAANFWQDVFRRFFNTTGAILMTSVSSVFIVLRALVGR